MITGDPRNYVGGLIRQLQADYVYGGKRSRRGFAVGISAILPVTGFSGFAECPGEPGCPGNVPWHQPPAPLNLETEIIDPLPPWVSLKDLKPDLPWYRDLFDFLKNTLSFGPSRAIQVSKMIPNGSKRVPSGLNTFGQCSFYERRTFEGCAPDPLMIGLMLAGGVLLIKVLQR